MSKTESRTASARAAGRRNARGKRLTRWIVVSFAIVVIIDAIVGERGLLAMLRARKQYDGNASALEQQRGHNARLRDEITRLTDDPAAIEEVARGELGFMRPGEKLFIVKDLKPPAAR